MSKEVSGKENKSVIRNEAASKPVKKKNPTVRRYLRYVNMIIIAGLLGMIIAGIKYFGTDKVKRNASVTIQFTYDGAAKNLTPTGEKFSINGLTSDKVLNDALASVGLSGKYTAESLRASLVITGQYPADVIDKIKDYDSLYDFSESRSVTLNNYYPTSYKVVLYDDFDTGVSSSDMERLIKAIGQTYKDYFISNYIYAFNPASIQDTLILDNYDYSYRIRIIKLHLQAIKAYAAEMYEKSTSFRSSGLSFNDIVIKCKNLENDSISNIEAAVMTDVLSVSATRLRNQYEYEIKLLETEKENKSVNLEEINGLLESYQLDGIMYFGSGDAVVKVDRNSKETYEKLIEMKKDINSRIVEIDSEIGKYKSFLDSMNSASASTEAKKNAISAQIKETYDKTVEIENLFAGLISNYNTTLVAEESVNLSENRFVSGKLFSTGFIATAIKCAAPLCIVIMILCALHAFIIERKKYQKEVQAAMQN